MQSVDCVSPIASYFDGAAGALFGTYHRSRLPMQHACGLVLCPPLFHEQVFSYYPLRHLAQRLAAAGFSTLRFDHHGTGNSHGDELLADRVGTWQRGLFAAANELRRLSGVVEVGFVGLHVGCLLALHAAAEHGEVASMILWDPCRSGLSYIKETSYLDLFIGGGSARNAQGSAEREAAGGFVLTAETLTKLGELDPRCLQRRPAPKMLLVQTRTADMTLAAHLQKCGVDLERQYLPGRWKLTEAPHRAIVPDAIFDTMIAWLKRVHPRQLPRVEQGVPGKPAAGLVVSQHSAKTTRETPIRFGEANRLFGILTEPPDEQGPGLGQREPQPTRPAILLLNSGCMPHVGPYRLYVTMARAWAALGHCVLRFDLSGLGESRPAALQKDNQIYPADAVRDIQEAMSALAKRQAGETFVLIGNCSGAAVAFQTALVDARVTGLAMLNPGELYFGERGLDAYDLEDFQFHHYLRALQDPHARPPLWKYGEARHALRILRRKLRRVALRLGRRIALHTVFPDAAADFQALLQRKLEPLLIFGENSLGLSALELHLGKNLCKLGSAAGIRVETIKRADHLFASAAAKAEVTRHITAYLQAHHP